MSRLDIVRPLVSRVSRRAHRGGATTALLLLAAGAIVAGATTAATAAAGDTRRPGEPTPVAELLPFRTPAPIEHPADNQPSAARRELGKLLFFDPRLSRGGRVSCASCHEPAAGWSDPRPVSIGDGGHRLERRSMPIENTAWAAALFWDGRAGSLEEQALAPVESPVEMNLTRGALEQRLNVVAEYRRRFREAYGVDSITAGDVGRALAAFERTVVSAPAPFDRWADGDSAAVSPEARRGFALFTGKAGCANCHAGWRFTDDSFHDIGVPVASAHADSGRAAILPGIESMRFAFKTPTLRNVAKRAPYLHDGAAATLDDVVALYDRGGVDRPSRSPLIKPLGLTAGERRALVAFLRTLSSPDTVAAPRALPR